MTALALGSGFRSAAAVCSASTQLCRNDARTNNCTDANCDVEVS
jgi:hypothetical protein